MEKPGNGKRTGLIKRYVIMVLLFFIIILPAAPDGFRNITSIIFNYYFDETFRLDTMDVLLVRVRPALSLKAELARVDTADWYKFAFALGPVINFTNNFYMVAVYGYGINSDGDFSHKGDINLTHESDTSVISFGARVHYFESNEYYYFLPSMSGAIYPIPRLRLFCKIFFSWDNADVISGSVWGEAGWSFTSRFTAHTGFTVSYTDGFGYSIIGGFKLKFTERFNLKYFCQYLSNTVEYLNVVEKKDGIVNGLIVDIRF